MTGSGFWIEKRLQQQELMSTRSANRGDASVTVVAGTDEPVQRFETTLTANRTVTVSKVNAWDGARFHVVRTGLGAFTLDVGPGLKVLPSGTAAWCIVDFDADTQSWALVAYGVL